MRQLKAKEEKQQLDELVLECIRSGQESFLSGFLRQARAKLALRGLNGRDIDASLQRLRRAGEIRYRSQALGWALADFGARKWTCACCEEVQHVAPDVAPDDLPGREQPCACFRGECSSLTAHGGSWYQGDKPTERTLASARAAKKAAWGATSRRTSTKATNKTP